MNLTEEIYARVLTLTEASGAQQQQLLRLASEGANALLAAWIPQDREQSLPREVLLTAGSYLAMADFLESAEWDGPERFTVGDITVQRCRNAEGTAQLRRQAERMIAPGSPGGFVFRGV